MDKVIEDPKILQLFISKITLLVIVRYGEIKQNPSCIFFLHPPKMPQIATLKKKNIRKHQEIQHNYFSQQKEKSLELDFIL